MLKGPELSALFTKRQQYELLRSQMTLERASFLPTWRDINDYILPRRGRFHSGDTNRGERRTQRINDSTATMSARTLASGMMSGVTSPARPWFRLTTPDPALSEVGAVKDWLYLVTQRLSTVFTKSNLYNVLPIVYGDIGGFATSAMLLEEDFEDVIRAYSFPIGSFMIGNNDRGQVQVFFREFRMTVRQIVERFGKPRDGTTGKIDWTNISTYVQNLYDQGMYEQWVEVAHCIKPNEEFDTKKIESKYKRFLSVYYERGTAGNLISANYMSSPVESKFLSEKGYDYFPVLAPRWELTGEDVYGTSCPGLIALGDVKQLQLGEKRIFEGIDKMLRPPMTAPTSLKHAKASILPGDITYVDVRDGQGGFRPAYEVKPSISEMEQKQEQCRGRIKKAFYEDLFLMLAESDRRQITAREVDERHEEKLLALGPVLEQLNQDLLDPTIENTFQIALAQSTDAYGRFIPGALIPEPPKELQGVPLRIEYISIMAQAQKLIGIGGIERFASFAQQVMQVSPEAIDKIDTDQMLDIYADMTSVPPGIVRPDDQVAQIRAQKQKAQQAQAQMQAMQQGSQAAKNLSQTDTSSQNALTDLLNQAKAGQIAPVPA